MYKQIIISEKDIKKIQILLSENTDPLYTELKKEMNYIINYAFNINIKEDLHEFIKINTSEADQKIFDIVDANAPASGGAPSSSLMKSLIDSCRKFRMKLTIQYLFLTKRKQCHKPLIP